MADTAKIFQEMRDSDSLRADLRQGALDRTQHLLGGLYDSALAKELVSGLQDAYRRVFEQGFFGKDVFDGRFASERPDAQAQDGPVRDPTAQGFGQQFYGASHEPEHDEDQEHGR